MYKASTLKLFFLLGLFVSQFSVAQIIIEEDEPQITQAEGSFRLLDYLSVDFGYSKADSAISREITIGAINWRQKFFDDKLLFSASIDYAETTLGFTLKRTDKAIAKIADGTLDEEDIPAEINLKRKIVDSPELEFHFQYSGIENLDAKAGYFTPSLGQFGVVSLVSLILPFSSEFVGYSFDKNDLFVPQPAVSFSYFLTDGLQLNAYASNTVEWDPLYYEFVASILVEPDSEDVITSSQARSLLQSGSNNFIRLLWQPSWGALGVTYSQGVATFDFVSRDTIGCLEYIAASNSTVDCATNLDAYSDDAELLFYRTYTHQAYVPDQEAISFEFSINTGQITWISEMLYTKSQTSIHELNLDEFMSKQSYVTTTEDYFSAASLYVFFDNNGQLLVETDSLDFGAGIEYRSKNDKTTIIAQFLGITNRYDDRYNRIVEALDNADDFLGDGVIPTFVMTHEHSLFNREATASVGLGFFGGFGGLFYNHSLKLNEHLSISAGLTSTLSFGELLLIFGEVGEYYEFDTGNFGLGWVIGGVINY